MNSQAAPPLLYLLCGKIASGKSSLAAELGARPGTIILSEDTWLGALFGEDMATGADYLRYSKRLQSVMAPHVTALLKSGVSVVLDFAANTPPQRKWMRTAAEKAGAPTRLYYLDVPEAVCLERLRSRNEQGTHPFSATEEQFHRFSAHFVPPTEAEGFEIIRP